MASKSPIGVSPARMAKLRELSATRQVDDVSKQLAQIRADGRSPDRIAFRRPYARLDIPTLGPYSDLALPPPELRPPNTRLLLPRGVAQAAYLTVLFVTQCDRAPGQAAVAGRPLSDPGATATSIRPWTDLIVVPAATRPGTQTSHRVETNRIRGIESAIRKLSEPDVRLVELPNRATKVEAVRAFMPLAETGLLGYPSRTAYTVPSAGEPVFTVPASYFTNGWHNVLTPSENAMLFAVWASSPSDEAGKSKVWLSGDTRIERYGLGPDAYGTQTLLSEFGVLDIDYPPGRRADGTFIGQKKGESPLLNGFRVAEDGFAKPALPIVMATIKGLVP